MKLTARSDGWLFAIALAAAASLTGCADNPAGPDAQAGADGGGGGDHAGLVYLSTGYTCGGGADDTSVGPFGTVNFYDLRGDSHVHARVQLAGVPEGLYEIRGNSEEVCGADVVDFDLRPLHDTSITVGANGNGNAIIGLTFVTETPGPAPDRLAFSPVDLLAMHAPGPHKLWLTIIGPGPTGPVRRSTAFDVVILVHEGH